MSVTKFCMGCTLVMVACGLVGTSGSAQTTATTPAKKTDAKKAAKKDDSQAEERLEAIVLARLKEHFKKQDINGDEYLDKSELITWLGLVKGPDILKKYDKNPEDGKLSLAEFTEWATTYADAYAKETIEDQKEAEAQVEKLQAAYTKAAAQAKAIPAGHPASARASGATPQPAQRSQRPRRPSAALMRR